MTRRRLHRTERQRGAALFLAILVLFILTVMGIGIMFTTSIEQTLAGTETKVSKIFYAADSGVEYAAAMLSTQVSYGGGAMPVGVSSHYPTLLTPDMQVTVSNPVILGYSIRPGDELASLGHGYGSTQVVENIYALTSSATSTATQANKAVDAEIGVYPKQLQTPQ